MLEDKKLILKPKIIEINESNDIYMTINMCILTNQVNLNNVRFTEDFIKGVVANKDEYIGIPLVVNRFKLENGLYNNLSHELDKKTGELKTDIIGSFTDFWEKEDENGVLQLMGSARIPKRFPNVCNAIVELYNRGELEFSCECLVYEYASVENGIRVIDYKGAKLFANCIVSHPAEVRAKAELLIAEALNKDFENGEKRNKENKVEIFANAELFSLSFDEIISQINNILNPLDSKGDRLYKYYIIKLYNDFVIVEDWYRSDILYKIPYRIEGNNVILSPENEWIKGTRGFVPDDDIGGNIVLNADKKKKIPINNSKDAADMTGSWGDVDKSQLREKIMSASNVKSLVKEAYLIVEEGWEDAPSEHLKYPHHVIKNGELVVSKDGVQTALSFLMRNDPNNTNALNHLKRHYNELGLEWPYKETNSKEEDFMDEKMKELQEKLSLLEKENGDLKEKLVNLEKELQESKALVVSKQEEILKMKEEHEKVLAENNELKKFKEAVEAEKKEKMKQELSEQYSKLLSEEVFKSEEVRKAIEECDVNKLNGFVVAELSKEIAKEKDKKEIITFSTQRENLIPTSKQEYLLAEVEDEE